MFTPPHLAFIKMKLLPRVKRVVVMGGAVFVSGNLFSKPANQHAEFNIYNDPHAAKWAFSNLTQYDIPVWLVTQDATKNVPIQQRLLDELWERPLTPEAQLAGGMMENLRLTWFSPSHFFETAFLWDPSAAVVAVIPKVVKTLRKIHIRVVIEDGVNGRTQGWTKPCDHGEIDKGYCAKLYVVLDLMEPNVTDNLLTTLQSKQNSAQRGLRCLGKRKKHEPPNFILRFVILQSFFVLVKVSRYLSRKFISIYQWMHYVFGTAS